MKEYRLPYVVVFIPAYNEENSIGQVIEGINKRYVGHKEKNYILEVIVVDDGSKDKTSRVAKRAGVKKIVSHPYNRGLGAATRTGLETALEMGADIAVKIDADFQHDPTDIKKVIRPILDEQADCVFGSRFMGGLKYKMPSHRAWGNRFFSWLVSFLTGLKVTDGQTGLMAFHKKYLAKFEIISDYNETQQLIIDSWAKHMRVMEVPVVFRKRKTGTSFISLKYPFKVLPTIFRLFTYTNPLKVFIPLGLLFILIGIIVGILVILKKTTFLGDATVSILISGGILIIFFGLLADLISKKK